MQLTRLAPAGGARVFVKLEYFNPTGSYKDRMAKAMIEGAERRGELRPKATVVEYTGGSTGSSLALICAVKGYRLKLVSSDAFAKEKLDTMRALGAEVILVPSDGGRITPDLIPRARAEAKRIHEEEGAFWTDQFNNPTPPRATLDRSRDLRSARRRPDAVAVERRACWSVSHRAKKKGTGRGARARFLAHHHPGPGGTQWRVGRGLRARFFTATSTTRLSPSTNRTRGTWREGWRGRRDFRRHPPNERSGALVLASRLGPGKRS
jgi:hypothetical protein